MNIYELPKIDTPKLQSPKKFSTFWKNRYFILFLVIVLAILAGGLGGLMVANCFYSDIQNSLRSLEISSPSVGVSNIESPVTENLYLPQTSGEEVIVKAVNKVSPAVVSIVITKDVPIIEQYYYNPFEEFFGVPFFEFQIPQYQQKGTEKREVGGGTGFIVSEDGMILTNKHVVLDEKADYTVFTNDGLKFPAKILARDPVQDIAILKIEPEDSKPFPMVKLGDSDKLQIGQIVITIGNVLGEFRNSVSVGVISGLGRTITASGGGMVETLEDVIQTDAAINQGNSGGPLLNLKGEVVGINTAMVLSAQNVGFAIPINKAKKDIEQVRALGKIVYPFLGVRYILINEQIQEENNLPVDYGAWLQKGAKGEPAVVLDSPAQKAGLKEGDIILEFNGEKITAENSLAKIIMKYNPGDRVSLKILRQGKEKIVEVTLDSHS